MHNRFVIIDTETTGNQPSRNNRIIQIGLVVIENGQIIERFSSFVNPKKEIPPFIQEFTGISNELVHGAPSFEEIADKIEKLLKGAYFVAHNVPFDLSFIMMEFKLIGRKLEISKSIDTVELARILYPTAESYQLKQLSQQFSFTHQNPHRADSDAEVTAKLFLLMLDKLGRLPLHTLQTIYSLATYLKSHIKELVKALINQQEKYDYSYEVVQGTDIKKREVTITRSTPTLAKEDYGGLLPLSKGQVKLSDTVKEAFASRKHALVEIPTQVGNSYAFLMPAIERALGEGEKFIITTSSKLLQRLVLKEQETLKEHFSFNLSFVKAKQSYLCIRKFLRFMEETEDMNYDIVLTKAQLVIWLTETNDGDIGELNLPSGGKLVCDRITGCTEACSGKPFNTLCFYLQKEKEVRAATGIVVNHDLFIQEKMKKDSFLDPFKNIILEEGESLENAFRSFFTKALSNQGIQHAFSKLEGLCTLLEKQGSFRNDMQAIREELLAVKLSVDELFRLLRHFVQEVHSFQNNQGLLTYIVEKEEEHFLWRYSIDQATDIREQINKLMSLVQVVIERLKTKKVSLVTTEGKEEIYACKRELKELEKKFNYFFSKRGIFRWMEIEERGPVNAASLYYRETNLEEKLKQLFQDGSTFVFLSPALTTIGKSFTYMLQRFGLKDSTTLKTTIVQPDRYKDMFDVVIPEASPNGHLSKVEASNRIASTVNQIIQGTEGRSIVIFPNLQLLQFTHEQLSNGPAVSPIIIAQGKTAGSKEKLLRNFMKFDNVVLFGTIEIVEMDTFPEDVHSFTLIELPFPKRLGAWPEEIVEDTRMYQEFELPQAILTLKKMFDIIRFKSKGLHYFYLLDSRFLNYKKEFFSKS